MNAPADFRAIRARFRAFRRHLLADLLRLESGRAIRRYEAGERAIPGPISLLMELLDRR